MTRDKHPNNPHGSLLKIVGRCLRARATVDDLTVVESDTIKYTEAGTAKRLTIVSERVHKPGTLLQNLEVIQSPDIEDGIVVQTEETAAQVAQLLTTPARTIEETRSQLYSTTIPLTVDGNPVVVPETTPEWWYEPSQTVLETTAGTIEVTLDHLGSVDSIALPRMKRESGQAVVYDADETSLAAFGNKADCQREWTVVRWPYCPEQWLFPAVTIYYIDQGELCEYELEPRLTDRPRLVQIAAITQDIVAELTVPSETTALPLENLIGLVRDAAQHRLGIHPQPAAIRRTLPNDLEIDNCLLEDGTQKSAIVNRAWRYPLD